MSWTSTVDDDDAAAAVAAAAVAVAVAVAAADDYFIIDKPQARDSCMV